MPPPLYAKEAADVKTAKDCKDGFDAIASIHENIDPKTSENQLRSLSSFTKEQALFRLSKNGQSTSSRLRFFKLGTCDKIDNQVNIFEDDTSSMEGFTIDSSLDRRIA